MKNTIACLALALSLAKAAPASVAPDALAASDVTGAYQAGPRASLMPLVGFVGGKPGIGLDLGFGYGPMALGARISAGNSLCIMCPAAEGETQASLLAGLRHEFPAGSVSLRSGISHVERTTTTRYQVEPGMNSEYDYHYRQFDGLGIPVQLDVLLGGRFVGGNLSMTAMLDRDGGSIGVMAGLPLGYLHR